MKNSPLELPDERDDEREAIAVQLAKEARMAIEDGTSLVIVRELEDLDPHLLDEYEW